MTDLFGHPSVAEAEQVEAARPVAVKTPRIVFAGFTAAQLVMAAGILVLLIRAMWVTRTLVAQPPQRIVKANLSRIVGDYVKAQARSTTPADQVESQMRLFMSSLETELEKRSEAGQVVLVGEAVLSKSVKDITPEVVDAVYASGVKRPQLASADQMIRSAPATIAPAQMQAPLGENAFSSMRGPGGEIPFDPSAQPAGASVSSFGGPDGSGQ